MSAPELAAAAGIAITTLRNAERDLSTPSPASIRKIAQALGCAPRDVWPPDHETPVAVRRHALGLSQRDLARIADVSNTTVHRAELGFRLRPKMAHKLAIALELPMEVVLPELPEDDE